MSASLPFRAARAAAFAVVSLGLGVLAHLVAGGGVSSPVALAGLVASFAAAFALAGRERPFAVILPLLLALQGGLHALFSLSHAADPAVQAGHAHAGLTPGLGMLVMHGWAVGLTALWLARGEALLWSLLRRLGVRLRVLLLARVDPAHTVFLAVPRDVRPRVPRSAVLRHTVIRRGPPAPAAASR
ncbi:MFS transporter [Bailinhaonella thermotolerans]|uniref:MFS transporter n=1 Tax=Bailinhaonella thermotolerans TaxID=1070861 RepID=A0A3A4ANL1_9ACTN|nr:MFS transporter [Bailinhaonella thermotolerans]RJL30139.1 MFS transporter [Bailinhaonella thermotolerans]